MPEQLVSGAVVYFLHSREDREAFDKAVREYAIECVERELEEWGHAGPAGGTLWAHEYMPGFFGAEQELVVSDWPEEAEERFLLEFGDAWDDRRLLG